MKRIISYILAGIVGLLLWGLLFSTCAAQSPALLSYGAGSSGTPPAPSATPSNFYHTTITVADGTINAFVYQPYDIDDYRYIFSDN